MIKGGVQIHDPGRMLMFIFQHPKGSGVELEVRVYGNVLNFSTRVTGGSGTYRIGAGYKVECEPVKMDDKVISFGKHDITALIHNSDDGRVYKYSASATSLARTSFESTALRTPNPRISEAHSEFPVITDPHFA